MSDCIFCRIVSGQQEAHTIAEDETALAFLDINPLADGHTMVIPRAHYERLEDLPAETAAALFATVHRVNRAIVRALDADGSTIGVNNGSVAGQAVPHLHVHIVPRHAGDGGGGIHTVVQAATGQDLGSVRERIERAIPAD